MPIPTPGTFTVGAFEQIKSGTPYGAVGTSTRHSSPIPATSAAGHGELLLHRPRRVPHRGHGPHRLLGELPLPPCREPELFGSSRC